MICDGTDHYDEDGNWIEHCDEAGTWPVDARAEHDDFERGAEDMELRARRLDAERDADLEAYWSQLEAEEQDGGR